MTTLETAILIDIEPEEALVVKPASDVPALPAAQLPMRLRLQQGPSRFRKYDKTWEFSAHHSGLLLKEVLAQDWTILGALFLRPYLINHGWIGRARPAELHFTPQLFWFRVRRQAKLQRLMLALAKAVDIEPGRLYFYHRGAQINPQSTAAQVRCLLFS
jgi:hypothetical protein